MSTLRFLLLEDNPLDAELVQAMLLDGKIDHELQRVDTGADFQTALLSDEFDLILADYALADFDGINALEIVRHLRPDVPFIFISGSLGEELAIAAIKQGATDYVLKQRLGRLVPSVQRALQEAQELDKHTTKHQQAEAAVESDLKDMQLLGKLSARLVTEGDIQTLYQEIMATAIALTRADAGTVQLLDEATQELVLLATQGFEQNMREYFYRMNASNNTSCGIALKKGTRIFVDFNVLQSEDPDGSRRMHVEAGYLSAQSTPLITRSGKSIGMVSTHWHKHYRPSDRELRFLDLLARQAADLIEHYLAQAALRESEEQYRTLFATKEQGFCIIEKVETAAGQPSDFRYVTVNPAFERHTGMRDVVGKTIREFVPNAEQRIMDIYEAVVRTGQPQQFEDYVSVLGLWMEVEVFPARSPGQIAVLFSNISERKRTEEQLRRVAETDAFRVKLSDALRSLFDPVEIQRAAMRVLGEHLAAERVCYGELTDDGEMIVIADNYLRGDAIEFIGQVPTSAYGKVSETLRAGHAFVFSDLDRDERLCDAEREAIRALSVISGATVPLVKQSRWVSSLAVHYSKPHQWTDDEIQLLQETADRTWEAVNRARAEAALRESEIQRIQEQSAREEERQRAETLAELDRAKTLFFSNVSHEFRTPLTLILAPVQDALSDSLNPLTSSQRERLELAHRNSLRLLKLVNTLLDFSRIQADRLKANYEPTDLSTYTAELASIFRSAIENANLQLVVDCPPLPDPIYVDREMWEKIVLNLLSNALKFTFEGIISVSLKPKANTVELIVSDTGVGIAASELPHVFERFYRVKGAKGRSYEGSGIGLSLVQELVKRHGGAIAVTSAVDQGTTFTVTIPTGIAHLPADQIGVPSTLSSTAVTANAFVEEAWGWLPEEEEGGRRQEAGGRRQEAGGREQGAGGTALDESTEFQLQNSEVHAQSLEVHAQSSEVQAQSLEVHVQSSEVHAQSTEFQLQSSEVHAQSSEVHVQSSKRARILLVDDNADMRDYLKRLLSQYYEVETVNDGLAALATIRRGGSAKVYDLVLTDVMMPRMDGFELLRSLRADPNTQTIPIILLSARAGEGSRVEGLETGADDYLIKPFSARELLARVKVNLQLAQLRREAVYREQVMQAVQTLNERLEQQVKARTAQLEAINQELEAFSSSVSHDLRTPLRYISSFAERLQGKLNPTLVDASSLQTLNIIIQSALQAEKMVDDLLEFSRLGQTEMHLTIVNISQLLQQVQAQLQPELVGRSLYWQIEALATVKGDPALLRIVLQNLLSNAVKYTRNNTEAVIAIGSIEQEQSVIFFVKDNGAGFDMKYYDRLFSMFQRLHPQEEFAGTGVGLATVRRIIHRHGGRIWAEGAIGEGATFYFSLPKHEA
ncbi:MULTISPECIES: ATP-binding protein [Nostoc]|uniref:histidine kinase n=2 Tax=Nostoc TaxID=1177 RepID=A0ABR8IGJ3_9NOSO|nr:MULTISPECIES: ATP-binding protein [Nostoc]MBD2565119.1 response regulator [Nostoc linckia FACHB-391]MBD2650720.1 response regulator [Nostoc foliaceum FACHB-393]